MLEDSIEQLSGLYTWTPHPPALLAHKTSPKPPEHSGAVTSDCVTAQQVS